MAGEAGVVGTPPGHYAGKGLQPFDVIDTYSFEYYDGNALKYLLRWDKKGSPLGDLKKAVHYIQETLLRWEASGHRRWGPGVVLGERTTPEAVIRAFGLTGNISQAVFHLLHWRVCAESACLNTARYYIEREIKELEEARELARS